ncbi:MAG TPA: hypothetical protein DCS09_11145 [Porphyromonadaceae bacterium]|nr:hypothetical protein [Porphyromonadaceae bacterium]
MTPERIRNIRKALNLTQNQLGKRVNQSGRTVENWEQGANVPNGAAQLILKQLEASISKEK